ncbi:D-Ala-D-Ala carboxypeptidase A. Serine peptidase. MEROPS family S11 [Alteribacillus bidgolensis]|uniref:serine-type D-Ala-D-Ala carboxypeptidase n=2 Tax=Alteribacillus bidgolensis TaxID=930129 RepID=A0A1G8LPA2_9BACI|nr:D-Ala-D-Ala carboxypeptidase A. Serine peptidase. MEROPS family S11 [Alteribacillus bidgolensis]
MKRMNWIKKSVIFSVCISILFDSGHTVSAAEPELEADSAILVEAETGKIVYQNDIDLVLPPASMTKIMSEYLVHEAVNNGEISWDEEVDISDKVRQLSLDTALSNVPLRQDETYTVQELYEAMAIYSANGATVALAEHIAGSESNFVNTMNEKAEELDLEEYEFVNSTGLNNRSMNGAHPDGTEADAENMLSARATAILTYHLLNDYPEVLDTVSIVEKTFKEGTEDYIEMQNWNWMLPEGPMPYEGVDGLKTGFTDLAGNAFTGTAERNGLRFISVVMRTESREARFEETAKLLDYGFDDFTFEEVVAEGDQFEEQETVPVTKGKEDEVTVSAGESLSVLVEEGETENVNTVVSLDEELLNEEGQLEAPIESGTVIGTVTVEEEGNNYLKDNMADNNQVPLVAEEDVEKAGWIALTFRGIGSFFGSVWSNAASFVRGLF